MSTRSRHQRRKAAQVRLADKASRVRTAALGARAQEHRDIVAKNLSHLARKPRLSSSSIHSERLMGATHLGVSVWSRARQERR